MGLRSPSSLVYQSCSSSRRSVPSMACSSLLSPAATISSPLHSDSAGVMHRVHLSLPSDSRFFPILQEQESQRLDLQSSYNGFCTSRGSIKAGFGRGGSCFGVRFLPPSLDFPDICDCARCKRNDGFSCSKNGGCVRRACCLRVREHSALLASSPPGRMGGRFRVWALSASLAYPPAGRREYCTRVRALSNTVASSLKKTDTASPANPNPSLTWGIIPHPPEASQKVIDYLRSKGIDTTELEDVELPSSIEVMQERLEFLTKIGLSMETINSYPLMVTCSIKKNLIPVLDYLEQLGFRSRDLPSFLEKYPMVLHSSVVIDLMPVIDYLLGLDIQRKDIHHVLMRFPDVLGFRLEGTMSTSVAYLVSIGVKPRSIGRMLTEYPEILGMRVANTIKPKVDLLLRHGIPKSIVARILEKRPYILGFDFNDTMQPAVDDLLEAGVKREAISAIITQYPDILGQSIKENFTRKTRWLVQQVKVAPCDVPSIIEKLPQVLFIKEGLAMERVTYFLRAGCSADDVAKMVTVCPQLLAMSISQALEPSLNFLRQDMKRSVKEVVKFPTYFTYDLKSRIMPRYKLIAEKGIDCSLEWFLNCSEQKFKVRLDADYIDDEDSGPVFQMGGPIFTENEQVEGLISAEGDLVLELDEQSWQQVGKRQQSTLSQEGGRKAVKLQHESSWEGCSGVVGCTIESGVGSYNGSMASGVSGVAGDSVAGQSIAIVGHSSVAVAPSVNSVRGVAAHSVPFGGDSVAGHSVVIGGHSAVSIAGHSVPIANHSVAGHSVEIGGHSALASHCSFACHSVAAGHSVGIAGHSVPITGRSVAGHSVGIGGHSTVGSH